jgi:hypothetical protein
VIAWPGNSDVPQPNPGENAISAPFSAISASRELIEAAVEVAATEDQPLGDREPLAEFFLGRLAQPRDQTRHPS